jgi:hypothetical protein
MAAPHSDPKAFAEWYEEDYFRRPRALRRSKVWTALAAAAVSLAAVAGTLWPSNRSAFQAGPLSPPHAAFNANCGACHIEMFATAARFLPANQAARSAPDVACLACHAAGAHNAHQHQFIGPDGQAAVCAACHREHRGLASLTRIGDDHCTACHADLPTADGRHRFAANIRSFDEAGGHPPFGTWRGQARLMDPGTIKFNHRVHLDLAVNLKDVARDRLGGMADVLPRLGEQGCTYCHQPDTERRYLLPIRYDNHCAGCHPLTFRPAGVADPAVADRWAQTPLPHPGRGETAAQIRGTILERYFRLLARPQTPPDGEPVRPPVLSPTDRDRARQLTGQTEARVFAPDGGGVIAELEKPYFRLKGGCAYCHEETSPPDARPDGLPVYALPHLRDRWRDVTFPVERFGPSNGERRSDAEQAARDRWFPYSRFSHGRHRDLDCLACHAAARISNNTGDVLLPDIADCRKCHNQSATGARADCLECHTYHDRSQEPHGLRGRRTLDQVLAATKAVAGPPGAR